MKKTATIAQHKLTLLKYNKLHLNLYIATKLMFISVSVATNPNKKVVTNTKIMSAFLIASNEFFMVWATSWFFGNWQILFFLILVKKIW